MATESRDTYINTYIQTYGGVCVCLNVCKCVIYHLAILRTQSVLFKRTTMAPATLTASHGKKFNIRVQKDYLKCPLATLSVKSF